MAIITANNMTDLARGSMARASAEATNAAILYELSSAFTAAGVTTATTTTAAKTVNSLTYTILGKFFSKGATDNFWTLGGAGSATTVAVSSFQKYIFLIDTAGAASVLEATQSTVSAAAVAWTNISAVSKWAAFIAAVGSTKAIVATVTVATDATHTFIPGTTAFTGTGITSTFIDGIDQGIFPLVGNSTGLVVGNGG